MILFFLLFYKKKKEHFYQQNIDNSSSYIPTTTVIDLTEVMPSVINNKQSNYQTILGNNHVIKTKYYKIISLKQTTYFNNNNETAIMTFTDSNKLTLNFAKHLSKPKIIIPDNIDKEQRRISKLIQKEFSKPNINIIELNDHLKSRKVYTDKMIEENENKRKKKETDMIKKKIFKIGNRNNTQEKIQIKIKQNSIKVKTKINEDKKDENSNSNNSKLKIDSTIEPFVNYNTFNIPHILDLENIRKQQHRLFRNKLIMFFLPTYHINYNFVDEVINEIDEIIRSIISFRNDAITRLELLNLNRNRTRDYMCKLDLRTSLFSYSDIFKLIKSELNNINRVKESFNNFNNLKNGCYDVLDDSVRIILNSLSIIVNNFNNSITVFNTIVKKLKCIFHLKYNDMNRNFQIFLHNRRTNIDGRYYNLKIGNELSIFDFFSNYNIHRLRANFNIRDRINSSHNVTLIDCLENCNTNENCKSFNFLKSSNRNSQGTCDIFRRGPVNHRGNNIRYYNSSTYFQKKKQVCDRKYYIYLKDIAYTIHNYNELRPITSNCINSNVYNERVILNRYSGDYGKVLFPNKNALLNAECPSIQIDSFNWEYNLTEDEKISFDAIEESIGRVLNEEFANWWVSIANKINNLYFGDSVDSNRQQENTESQERVMDQCSPLVSSNSFLKLKNKKLCDNNCDSYKIDLSYQGTCNTNLNSCKKQCSLEDNCKGFEYNKLNEQCEFYNVEPKQYLLNVDDNESNECLNNNHVISSLDLIGNDNNTDLYVKTDNSLINNTNNYNNIKHPDTCDNLDNSVINSTKNHKFVFKTNGKYWKTLADTGGSNLSNNGELGDKNLHFISESEPVLMSNGDRGRAYKCVDIKYIKVKRDYDFGFYTYRFEINPEFESCNNDKKTVLALLVTIAVLCVILGPLGILIGIKMAITIGIILGVASIGLENLLSSLDEHGSQRGTGVGDEDQQGSGRCDIGVWHRELKDKTSYENKCINVERINNQCRVNINPENCSNLNCNDDEENYNCNFIQNHYDYYILYEYKYDSKFDVKCSETAMYGIIEDDEGELQNFGLDLSYWSDNLSSEINSETTEFLSNIENENLRFLNLLSNSDKIDLTNNYSLTPSMYGSYFKILSWNVFINRKNNVELGSQLALSNNFVNMMGYYKRNKTTRSYDLLNMAEQQVNDIMNEQESLDTEIRERIGGYLASLQRVNLCKQKIQYWVKPGTVFNMSGVKNRCLINSTLTSTIRNSDLGDFIPDIEWTRLTEENISEDGVFIDFNNIGVYIIRRTQQEIKIPTIDRIFNTPVSVLWDYFRNKEYTDSDDTPLRDLTPHCPIFYNDILQENYDNEEDYNNDYENRYKTISQNMLDDFFNALITYQLNIKMVNEDEYYVATREKVDNIKQNLLNETLKKIIGELNISDIENTLCSPIREQMPIHNYDPSPSERPPGVDSLCNLFGVKSLGHKWTSGCGAAGATPNAELNKHRDICGETYIHENEFLSDDDPLSEITPEFGRPWASQVTVDEGELPLYDSNHSGTHEFWREGIYNLIGTYDVNVIYQDTTVGYNQRLQLLRYYDMLINGANDLHENTVIDNEDRHNKVQVMNYTQFRGGWPVGPWADMNAYNSSIINRYEIYRFSRRERFTNYKEHFQGCVGCDHEAMRERYEEQQRRRREREEERERREDEAYRIGRCMFEIGVGGPCASNCHGMYRGGYLGRDNRGEPGLVRRINTLQQELTDYSEQAKILAENHLSDFSERFYYSTPRNLRQIEDKLTELVNEESDSGECPQITNEQLSEARQHMLQNKYDCSEFFNETITEELAHIFHTRLQSSVSYLKTILISRLDVMISMSPFLDVNIVNNNNASEQSNNNASEQSNNNASEQSKNNYENGERINWDSYENPQAEWNIIYLQLLKLQVLKYTDENRAVLEEDAFFYNFNRDEENSNNNFDFSESVENRIETIMDTIITNSEFLLQELMWNPDFSSSPTDENLLDGQVQIDNYNDLTDDQIEMINQNEEEYFLSQEYERKLINAIKSHFGNYIPNTIIGSNGEYRTQDFIETLNAASWRDTLKSNAAFSASRVCPWAYRTDERLDQPMTVSVNSLEEEEDEEYDALSSADTASFWLGIPELFFKGVPTMIWKMRQNIRLEKKIVSVNNYFTSFTRDISISTDVTPPLKFAFAVFLDRSYERSERIILSETLNRFGSASNRVQPIVEESPLQQGSFDEIDRDSGLLHQSARPVNPHAPNIPQIPGTAFNNNNAVPDIAISDRELLNSNSLDSGEEPAFFRRDSNSNTPRSASGQRRGAILTDDLSIRAQLETVYTRSSAVSLDVIGNVNNWIKTSVCSTRLFNQIPEDIVKNIGSDRFTGNLVMEIVDSVKEGKVLKFIQCTALLLIDLALDIMDLTITAIQMLEHNTFVDLMNTCGEDFSNAEEFQVDPSIVVEQEKWFSISIIEPSIDTRHNSVSLLSNISSEDELFKQDEEITLKKDSLILNCLLQTPKNSVKILNNEILFDNWNENDLINLKQTVFNINMNQEEGNIKEISSDEMIFNPNVLEPNKIHPLRNYFINLLPGTNFMGTFKNIDRNWIYLQNQYTKYGSELQPLSFDLTIILNHLLENNPNLDIDLEQVPLQNVPPEHPFFETKWLYDFYAQKNTPNGKNKFSDFMNCVKFQYMGLWVHSVLNPLLRAVTDC